MATHVEAHGTLDRPGRGNLNAYYLRVHLKYWHDMLKAVDLPAMKADELRQLHDSLPHDDIPPNVMPFDQKMEG